MERFNYSKEIQVKGEYDVLICGGGPGGIGAAISSAENGSKTILVEKLGFLGGLATAGLVNPMCEFGYEGIRVTGGIPYRFANKLIRAGGAMFEPPKMNLSFNPEKYKLVAQRMILSAGVELLTNTSLVDCIVKDGNIVSCIFHNRDGLFAIKAKCFVDATGDAFLASMAGVPMLEDTRPKQPGSLCFKMAGVDTQSPRMHIIHQKNNHFNHQAVFIREVLEKLEAEGKEVPQYGGPWLCTTMNPGEITLNFTRSAMDCTKQDSFTKAEQKMLEDVFILSEMIRKHVPEFKEAYISQIATVAGARQGRRIAGLFVMTGEDYIKGTRFEDSIARACHPVDVHLPNNQGQSLTFPERAAFIPYRCLVSNAIDNLLMAGRAISVDEDTFAAVRVQAPCMEIGQAAGVAASLAVKENTTVQNIDVTKLVEIVKSYGSFV
ncbi:MAG: FAD-dependent oxidoreductase [Peptococcales bacterium]|jgi:hypothetical protein